MEPVRIDDCEESVSVLISAAQSNVSKRYAEDIVGNVVGDGDSGSS